MFLERSSDDVIRGQRDTLDKTEKWIISPYHSDLYLVYHKDGTEQKFASKHLLPYSGKMIEEQILDHFNQPLVEYFHASGNKGWVDIGGRIEFNGDTIINKSMILSQGRERINQVNFTRTRDRVSIFFPNYLNYFYEI